MVYKHAYSNTLLLLRSAFMLRVVKMPLKLEVGGHTLNSHRKKLCVMDNGTTILEFCFKFSVATLCLSLVS